MQKCANEIGTTVSRIKVCIREHVGAVGCMCEVQEIRIKC